MKLVVIYGPPAAGKLTVAKCLANLTGFRLFHNHLSHDFARSIFEANTDEFWRFLAKVRLQAFEGACEANLPGLIFTTCFTNLGIEQYIENMISIVERHNGEIRFVYLTCLREELERRVASRNRGKIKGKINTIPELRTHLINHNFYPKLKFVESLELDNTTLSPEDAAVFNKNLH